jgi:O-antigen ligase
LSPHAAAIRSAIYLGPTEATGWEPLSVSPASTAYASGLVLTALVVFWAARTACARGMTRRIVRTVALAGLVAALLAIVFQSGSDPSLIYGRWHALEPRARPFGPFVNRNHFATWVVMACPLAAGYVVAAISARRPSRGRLVARFVTLLEGIGTSTVWVGVAAVVMALALVRSTSRSGLTAFGVSLVGAAWLARGRLTRRTGVLALLAVLAIAAIIAAYVNVEPLFSRVEETLAVGAGGRPRIWQETLRVIRDFPLTGTGLGTYQTAMLVYQQTDRAISINQAHNQYLHLLAEGGVLLAIPVVLTVVAFIALLRKRLAQDSSSAFWLRIGGAIAMLAVAVQGFWETGLRIPANGLLFAIAAAVAIHGSPESELAPVRLPGTARRDPEREQHLPYSGALPS